MEFGGDIFQDLYIEFMFWSVIVGVITFVWMIHHSFVYRTSDGDLSGKRLHLRTQLDSLRHEMKRAGMDMEFEIEEEEDERAWPNVDNIKVGVFPKENDNLKLELFWTIIPFILICYLCWISWAPTDAIWPSAYELEDAHEVGVTGQQWFWDFDCKELTSDLCDVGVDSETGLTVLSLKLDETYILNLSSRDVLHAPKIVQYGLTEDAVPGMYTTIVFTPYETGKYFLDCAEYCGDDHAYMTAIIEIHA